MKQTKYARVGEFVRVVTPKRFERVGYPLTLNMVDTKFCEEVKTLTNKLMACISSKVKFNDVTTLGDLDIETMKVSASCDDFVTSLLHRAVCAYILRREHFGGDTRRVYERDQNLSTDYDLTGRVCLVTKKRFIKTGKYASGYCSSWDNEGEPPELYDVETHCLYTVQYENPYHAKLHEQILARNCERIINDQPSGT